MKKGIQKVLVMLLALSMIFSTMAMPAFADDGTPAENPSASEVTLEDGTYVLPDLKAGPSEMFNHFVAGSRFLVVNGDTATIRFITDGSTGSIQKYSKIALGKSSELVQTNYQADLPEGTTIIEGVLQEEQSDVSKYLFEIAMPKEEVEALLTNDTEADIFITVWNKVGSSADKIPGWYKAKDDIYLSLGSLGEKIDPAASADYRDVDAAIAAANALDLSLYTEETAGAVTNAINAVVRDKTVMDQPLVDAMADAINTAVAALVLKEETPDKTELTINNTTSMFKAVSAHLATEEGQEYLVVALSSDGYKDVFKGTYEQAVINGDGKNNNSWIHGYTNGEGKLEFKIPVDADETYIPLVSVSNSYYQKYLNGENGLERSFYPRQVILDRNTMTLTTGDYDDVRDMECENNVSMFNVSKAQMHVVGGPNSNTYKTDLILTMGSTSYDKMFVGTIEEAEQADAIALADGNTFTFSVKDLLGKTFVASFHSKSKDTWYERLVTISADGTGITFDTKADYSAVTEALTSVPKDLSIYTDATAKAVREAVDAVDYTKKAAEQADVDAMAAAIKTAVGNLKKLADYSKVDEAMAKVPADLSIYTTDTRKAVEDAVAAIVKGKSEDEQSAVDSMATAINSAVAGLKIDIAKAQVTGLKDQTYSGKAFAPAPVVTVNGKQLDPKNDYTVSYKNNTNAGKATVTVTGKGDYAGTATATFTIAKAAQSVTGPKATINKTYGAKAFNVGAKTNGGGKITYTTSNAKVAVVSSAGKVTIKGAGTAKITIKAAETTNYKAATKTVTVKIAKAANKMTASGKTAKVSYSKLKKGKQTVTKAKAFAVKNNNGKVTFTKKKGNAKITVSKAGKITVKKGLKKGTYRVKVKVKAAGNSNYKVKTKTVTVTIKVK